MLDADKAMEGKRSKFYLMLLAVCGKSGAVCLYKVLRVVS